MFITTGPGSRFAIKEAEKLIHKYGREGRQLGPNPQSMRYKEKRWPRKSSCTSGYRQFAKTNILTFPIWGKWRNIRQWGLERCPDNKDLILYIFDGNAIIHYDESVPVASCTGWVYLHGVDLVAGIKPGRGIQYLYFAIKRTQGRQISCSCLSLPPTIIHNEPMQWLSSMYVCFVAPGAFSFSSSQLNRFWYGGMVFTHIFLLWNSKLLRLQEIRACTDSFSSRYLAQSAFFSLR